MRLRLPSLHDRAAAIHPLLHRRRDQPAWFLHRQTRHHPRPVSGRDKGHSGIALHAGFADDRIDTCRHVRDVGGRRADTGRLPRRSSGHSDPGPWGHGGVDQSTLSARPAIRTARAHNSCRPATMSTNRRWERMLFGMSRAPVVAILGAVATMLDHLPPVTPYGDLYNVYNALDLLNFGEPYRLRSALVQLGGQAYADFGSIEAKTAQGFTDLLMTRLASRRALAAGVTETAAQAKFADAGSDQADSGTRVWLSASGGMGQLAGDASDGISTVDYTSAAIAAGIDYQSAPEWTFGAGFGYARNDVSFAGLSNSGSIDNYQAALYAGYAEGAWYFDAAAGYAFASGALNRRIAFPGVWRETNGDPDADIFLSAFEAGYALGGGAGFATTPFARLQATAVHQNSFDERRRRDRPRCRRAEL